MINPRKVRASIVYKITAGLTLIVGILVAVLVSSNIYSLQVVKSNMINASQNQLAIYMNSINNILTGATRDLDEISVKYMDSIVNYRNMSELDKYLSSTQLRDVISTKVITNNTQDGLFVLGPNESLLLIQFSNRVYSNERTELIHFFNSQDFSSGRQISGNWSIMKIGGSKYLLKGYRIYDYYVGALIKTDSLLSFIQKDSFGETQYVLTNAEGEILSHTAAPSFLKEEEFIPNGENIIENYQKKYFIISTDVQGIEARFSSIIETKSVLSGLDLMQWVIIVLGVTSIFTVPLAIVYLLKNIIKPVRQLIAAIKEVEKGNWDYRMPGQKVPMEFARLNTSFASMVKEIKTLKIDSYEEKIERQKAELKYLQMQIKPHFFLNAITTISSLTYQSKNEEIRRLIDLLSRHLRYMFKGGLVKIPLSEEIEHVKNYISMQEIRFPNNIFPVIEIEPGAESCLLPQFIIQTFVENCFKHALSVGTMLSILIKAELTVEQETEYVRISIEDNGEGFPNDVIEAIHCSKESENHNGKKIGIINIKKTLQLLYKMDGLLKIKNCEPFGARVEISVPLDKEGKDALSACG